MSSGSDRSAYGSDASDRSSKRSDSPDEPTGDTRQPVDTASKHSFEGSIVTFQDGSRWKITKPLSQRAYQQNDAPFEARQVFTCVCIDDPNNAHSETDKREAVMKIKYQVTGNYARYKDLVEEYEERAAEAQDTEKAAKNLETVRSLLHTATHPVYFTNESAAMEISALKYFKRMNCPYTPHLLGYTLGLVTEDTDDQGLGMVGGLILYILMTKVPGRQLRVRDFFRLPPSEREELRRALKEALIRLWRRIEPQDSALRNLLWDSEARKCYIVDFEDYRQVRCRNPESEWEDRHYRYWDVDESCHTKYGIEDVNQGQNPETNVPDVKEVHLT
ncbi:hypothetical protein M011DRAFT_455281 [Sporormia fimetaria CBS 119925]|uniref:Protein kinase domain-containing protein n=1 Tax=Sporormia fimetaria CBS 119925 TaxID=1340428 RepID=A0A6A6VNU7_9PLEO|nr:hypothetical protein M011DRAFT_455281 [Sporormia fimetaria CBS 119925]